MDARNDTNDLLLWDVYWCLVMLLIPPTTIFVDTYIHVLAILVGALECFFACIYLSITFLMTLSFPKIFDLLLVCTPWHFATHCGIACPKDRPYLPLSSPSTLFVRFPQILI
jgi:hypothetical protein